MKLLFSFLLLNISFISTAQIPSYVPTNGLVGYWSFTGNANDESGNGNNGTVNGATLTSDRFGNANSAYHFTLANSNYIIALGNNLPIGSASSTMSIWFKASGFSISGASRAMLSFGRWNGNQARYIGQRGGSSNLITYAQLGNDKNCTLNYLLNTWYHFVATYESGVVKIYINSNLLGTYSITGTATAVGNVYFGSHPSLGDYFDGDLDDASIYNRALSQAEITAIYNDTTTIPTTPPTTSEDTTSNVGIGTVTPKRKLHVNDVMRLEPRNTAPINPAKGDIYFDGVLNKLRVYDGTVWQNCW